MVIGGNWAVEVEDVTRLQSSMVLVEEAIRLIEAILVDIK
jgi:hypothetical protein